MSRTFTSTRVLASVDLGSQKDGRAKHEDECICINQNCCSGDAKCNSNLKFCNKMGFNCPKDDASFFFFDMEGLGIDCGKYDTSDCSDEDDEDRSYVGKSINTIHTLSLAMSWPLANWHCHSPPTHYQIIKRTTTCLDLLPLMCPSVLPATLIRTNSVWRCQWQRA